MKGIEFGLNLEVRVFLGSEMQGLQRGLGREEKDFFFMVETNLFHPFYLKWSIHVLLHKNNFIYIFFNASNADKSCKYMKQFESYDFKIKE